MELFHFWHFGICWTNSMALVSFDVNPSFYFEAVISSTLKLSHPWTRHCAAFSCFVCAPDWADCDAEPVAAFSVTCRPPHSGFCNTVLSPRCCAVKLGESMKRIEGTRTATLAHLHSGATGCRTRSCSLVLCGCSLSSRGEWGGRWWFLSLILSYSLWLGKGEKKKKRNPKVCSRSPVVIITIPFVSEVFAHESYSS